MARPVKNTVDYFPHDAHTSEGRTVSILENNFGHEGYSAWFKLLERVSTTDNHVISIRNPEDMEFLAAKLRLSPERLKIILAKMADLDAIDKPLFESGQIWCQHLIDRLEPVYRNRKQEPPTKPELSDIETPVPTVVMPVTTPCNTHSKVKRSREEKRRVESIETKSFGEFQNVILTDEEQGKLVVRFGETDTGERIERLSAAMSSKGYKYKSHYATILNWARNDNGKRNVNGQANTTGRASGETAQPEAIGRVSPFAKYRGNTGESDEGQG